MTRFKEYARQKGFRLECDYPCIPYDTGKSQNVLGVWCMSLNDCVRVITEFNSLVCYADINRNGNIEYNYD